MLTFGDSAFVEGLRKEAGILSSIGKAVTSPKAFARTFRFGERVGRGAANVAGAGAVAGAHAATAGAGAVKGFANRLIVEPAKKWATAHPQASKAIKYGAAGVGAAGALGGGAYAIHKATDKTTYGSNPNPRYY